MERKRNTLDWIKTNRKFIWIPTVVVSLLSGILIYFSIYGQARTVATYERVWTTIENHGITPTDTTELYRDAWNDFRKEALQKALTFKEPNSATSFNFFVFDDEQSAHSTRAAYWSYLRYESGRFGTRATNQEYTSSASNFTISWVKHDNFYTVCTRVGNTVVYAETNADANQLVKDILAEIGYQ